MLYVSPVITVTTTGTVSKVIINDLGALEFIHPTIDKVIADSTDVNYFNQVLYSQDLQAAITQGKITIFIDGQQVTSLSSTTNIVSPSISINNYSPTVIQSVQSYTTGTSKRYFLLMLFRLNPQLPSAKAYIDRYLVSVSSNANFTINVCKNANLLGYVPTWTNIHSSVDYDIPSITREVTFTTSDIIDFMYASDANDIAISTLPTPYHLDSDDVYALTIYTESSTEVVNLRSLKLYTK